MCEWKFTSRERERERERESEKEKYVIRLNVQ